MTTPPLAAGAAALPPEGARSAAGRPGGGPGARIKVGISACFFHADPKRPIFTGKTLQYVEQSVAHWVMSTGALAVMIPSPVGDTQKGDASLADYAEWLDALVLEGGSDLWPGSYGEEALDERWQGDRVRDEYEKDLLAAFASRGKPVLGICRGLQLMNVAHGGTLLQDIDTQRPGAVRHRDPVAYDRNLHPLEFVAGTRLAEIFEGDADHGGEQRPPPGDQGPGARLPGRGALPGRRHDRGDPQTGADVHGGGAVAPGVPSQRRGHARRSALARRFPGRGTNRQAPMTDSLVITNPATGERLAEVPADDAASVAAKYRRARAAQPAWAARPLAERHAAIVAFRGRVVAELETLAATLTAEVGKPIAQSRNELNGFLGRIDFFLAEVAASTANEEVFADAAITERIGHDPLGVVANVSAWNYPYFVGGNVFVPALLTGNAVLYKPSEFATLTGLHIARLLHASGVPGDVFIALVGGGEVGGALIDQPVDGVFFTGSAATGAKIAAAAGPRMIRLQLELGGKDPTYVAEDADPTAAAQSLADGAMYNTGQSCCSVERIYVHERIHDAFVEAFLATVQGFKVGDPADAATYIGAITRAPQIAVLEAQLADALAKGGQLRTGGRRIDRPGNWFEPSVVTNASHEMLLMREESFGPVIGIQKVGNDDEAVALMNDTRYGLTAGVYSRDEARAARLLAKVNAGSVYWNCCDRVSPRLPWSGLGDSGVGVTLSRYGILTFTRPKAWHLRKP